MESSSSIRRTFGSASKSAKALFAVAILSIPIAANPTLAAVSSIAAGLFGWVLIRPDTFLYLVMLLTPLDKALPYFSVPVLGVAGTSVNVLTLIAVAGLSVRWLVIADKRGAEIRWSPVLTIFAFFVAWNFASITWAAVRPERAVLRALEWLLFFGFFVLVATYLRNEEQLYRAMRMWALAGWFIILSSVADLLQASPERLAGLFGNPNSLATPIIACLLGIVLSERFGKRSSGLRMWMEPTVYLSLAFIIIVLSASRASLLALALVVPGLLIIRPSTRLAAALMFAAAVLSYAAYPGIFDTVIRRFNDSLLAGRGDILRIAWDYIQQNPWIGYGAGQSPLLIGEEYSALIGLPEAVLKVAHNPILEVWLETGLLGAILYIAMLLTPYLRLLSLYVRSGRTLPPQLRVQIEFLFIVSVGYLTVWLKNGGSTHSKEIFVFLGVALLLHELGARSLAREHAE